MNKYGIVFTILTALWFLGVMVVGCEPDEPTPSSPQITTDTITTTISSVWETSVPNYLIRFTMLGGNWVHCDVNNESEYTFFFSDNCDYKYEWYDGQDNMLSIVQRKDSTGSITNYGNEIYFLDRISPDSIVITYEGTQPSDPCEWCIDNFYLHKIQ